MIVAQIGCNEIRSDTVLYVFFAVYVHVTRSTYTTIQKFQVSSFFFFFFEWNDTFIQQGCIKLTKVAVNTVIMLQKINFK